MISAPPIIHGRTAKCSFGAVLQANTDQGVCTISLGDDETVLWHELQDKFVTSHVLYDSALDMSQILALLDDPWFDFNLPVVADGTPFQQSVWQALRQITVGYTRSYAEIAQAIGKPTAVRAVASACAANPIAVVVPCHRVIRADGSLGGYRWGEARKKKLLCQENGRHDC